MTSANRFALWSTGKKRANFVQTNLLIEVLEDRNLLSVNPLNPRLAPPPGDSSSTDYEPDSILVRFQPGVATALRGANFLPGTDLQPEISLVPGLHIVTLSAGVTVPQALAAYRASSQVMYAEPNFRVHAVDTIPNDPYWNNSGLWGLRKIQSPAAWDYNTGSGYTVVASIDTGVDYNHRNLNGNMWTSPVDGSYGHNYITGTNDPLDDNGHGSHTSGTMAAVGNQGIGLPGVNWSAQIMALKILNSSGSGSIGLVVNALNFAVQNGAAVSNNSYGCYSCYSQAAVNALQNAAANYGHIFVAAAGNDNRNIDTQPFYPASYSLYSDNVIAVAATTTTDARASFSNYGANTVQLGAPGNGVLSTWRNGGYATESGTSMASPHVAGAAALIWDTYPYLGYRDVISDIVNTTDYTGLVSVSGGRLNLYNAIVAPLGGSPGSGGGHGKQHPEMNQILAARQAQLLPTLARALPAEHETDSVVPDMAVVSVPDVTLIPDQVNQFFAFGRKEDGIAVQSGILPATRVAANDLLAENTFNDPLSV